ncbi:ABC transporter permease [Paenibacillus sp. PR3]|uniref:ABC transporter permease n=1 Tax=Paenibacillus terricola TaxID=2763503 RepID=A0ABR8N573_9BACL|nr:ABC transporter permease [Paenibacillus terricola]MBD3922696.1 ABC transporter permease [Paenibacillus terricola]
MWAVLRSEWIKWRKSPILWLIFVSPALCSLIGLLESDDMSSGNQWDQLLHMMGVMHALLLMPLLTGVFAASVCRLEHAGGGWKQLLALPVSRGAVYICKFVSVMLLLLATQAVFLAALLLVGMVKGYTDPIQWSSLLFSLIGSWIACMPLAALQMGVSVAWASFAAPLAINAIFTLPNIIIANSERFAPYYPWDQPVLVMLSQQLDDGPDAFHLSMTTLYTVISVSFILFFVVGHMYFRRKPI